MARTLATAIRSEKKKPISAELAAEKVQYTVCKILDMRIANASGRKPKVTYLVSWEGYDEDEDSWETEENVKEANGHIIDFFERHVDGDERVGKVLEGRAYQLALERARERAAAEVKYEIADIVGHTCVDDKYSFEVAWKGYEAHTWESGENWEDEDATILIRYMEANGISFEIE